MQNHLIVAAIVCCFIQSVILHQQQESTTISLTTLSSNNNITDFKYFSFLNGPTSYELNKEQNELVIKTSPQSDFWRKVYYGFIHDNGNFFYTKISNDVNFTMRVTFEADYVNQYDQAGLMVRFNEKYWLKTGIEYVPYITGKMQVSAVYTNDKSDWSVVSLGHIIKDQQPQQLQDKPFTIHMQVRRLSDCFIAEYKLNENDDYTMIRLGYLNNDPSEPIPSTIQVGVVACSPIGDSVSVKFSNYSLSINK
jgi:regulation of enolase protein 1 (concanavalin A-like superfamily)